MVGLALGVGDDAAGEADDARLVAYVGYGVKRMERVKSMVSNARIS